MQFLPLLLLVLKNVNWILAAFLIVSPSSCWWYNIKLFSTACFYENDFHLHVLSTWMYLMYCCLARTFHEFSHSISFLKVHSLFPASKLYFGFVNVGDKCLTKNVLMTRRKFWWQISGINIAENAPIFSLIHQ